MADVTCFARTLVNFCWLCVKQCKISDGFIFTFTSHKPHLYVHFHVVTVTWLGSWGSPLTLRTKWLPWYRLESHLVLGVKEVVTQQEWPDECFQSLGYLSVCTKKLSGRSRPQWTRAHCDRLRSDGPALRTEYGMTDETTWWSFRMKTRPKMCRLSTKRANAKKSQQRPKRLQQNSWNLTHFLILKTDIQRKQLKKCILFLSSCPFRKEVMNCVVIVHSKPVSFFVGVDFRCFVHEESGTSQYDGNMVAIFCCKSWYLVSCLLMNTDVVFKSDSRVWCKLLRSLSGSRGSLHYANNVFVALKTRAS